MTILWRAAVIDHALLCGDPQQPSEYMYQSAGFLEESGIELSRMDWHSEVSATQFRELTMEMERRGPGDYDTSAIAARLDGVELLIVHKAPVSRSLIENGSDLAVIGCARGGTENIDLEAADDHDIIVLHAPGRNRNAVADYACALILAAVRRVPYFAETTRRGEWALEFDPAKLPRDLAAQTIGIVGFGKIGRGVTERMAGFGSTITVHDPYVDEATIREAGARPDSLEGVLDAADVVSLHVRLTEETHGLIGERELEMLGEEGILVNTARGRLVEEDALIDALENDSINAAALDVFHQEPLPTDHPFLEINNVILSPHTAGSTRDSVLNGSRIIADQIVSILDGKKPAHRIV